MAVHLSFLCVLSNQNVFVTRFWCLIAAWGLKHILRISDECLHVESFISTEYIISTKWCHYFQFFCWIFFNIFYCLRFIKTIDKIEKNWKGKLKRIWRHWLKIEYSVLIKRIYNILSKKLSMDSVMFQVMLVILLDQGITGWSFLPRIEIMISLIFHVLNDSKVLGGTTYNTNTSNV